MAFTASLNSVRDGVLVIGAHLRGCGCMFVCTHVKILWSDTRSCC